MSDDAGGSASRISFKGGLIGGLVAGVVLLVGVAVAAFLYISSDSADPEASLGDEQELELVLEDLEEIDTGEIASLEDAAVEDPEDGSPTGVWRVIPGDAGDDATTFVGYRIEEIFAADTLKKTATGRTPAVDGGLVIDGTQVTAAEFRADVTQLASDSLRRDTYIANNALQTDEFTEATFVLTEPIDLGAVPAHDEVVAATAVGELTLHGITRSVTLDLEAQWDGTVIQVVGSTHIVLADYDIDPPDIPGIVKVDPEGELELKLNLARPS